MLFRTLCYLDSVTSARIIFLFPEILHFLAGIPGVNIACFAGIPSGHTHLGE